MKNHLLHLFLLLGLARGVRAQQQGTDFVVTAAGDTLRGQIKFSGADEARLKLLRPNLPAVEYQPDNLRSYGNADGTIAVSKQIGARGPVRFLKPLVLGYVSLYERDAGYRKLTFYLQPPDSTHVREVLLESSQLTLAQVLVGCPELEFGTMAFKKRYPYSREGMVALVKAYNGCRRPSQASFRLKKVSRWTTALSLKGGLNRSGLRFDTYESSVSMRDALGYHGSIGLVASSRTAFSLQIELMYSALKGEYGPFRTSDFNPNNSPLLSQRNLVRLDFQQLQIPLLARYEVGHGSWRPYLNLGGIATRVLQNKSYRNFQSLNGQPFSQIPINFFRAAYTGVAGGGGLTVRNSTGSALTVELRYEYIPRFIELNGGSSPLTVLRLNAGVLLGGK